MFSGIITHQGTIARALGERVWIHTTHDFLKRTPRGTSVAVEGVCLTVVDRKKDSFAVDLIPETKRRTRLGALKKGARVNLELPVTPASFLSGHMVQGHVDGVARIAKIKRTQGEFTLKLSLPKALFRYVVSKGSITIDGVALTIMTCGRERFTVGLTPYTEKNTTLGSAHVGDVVNVEVDVLAKYVEQFFQKRLETKRKS